MNSPVAASSQLAAPPSSAWVRFLRSYGPTPNNLTLFDEFVTDNLVKAKVKPITLSSPQLEKIKERVCSGEPGSILIAGTAGDGKTYHCRSLWTHLGGAEKDWTAKTTVKHLKLADGRQAIFVKDLSELNDDESDAALAVMERSMNGEDTLDRRFAHFSTTSPDQLVPNILLVPTTTSAKFNRQIYQHPWASALIPEFNTL